MNAVIIVAGGKGLRMGGDIPKQFLPVGDKPILMRTIERFLQYDKEMQVVLVLPESQQDYWQTLCSEYNFSLPYVLANGGETRFHSVKNGLAKVSPDATLIGVHDGVRPFVSIDTIRACYDEAVRSEAVVPVIDVVETVRHILKGNESETVSRNDYKLVQTPQVFSASLLRAAYSQPYIDFFTDDASVVERFGHPVTLVQGNRENIKITTPFDLKVAEALGA
ncbi:MAG: 2-C-methyl-D-erythritol 4-phosphate cytidylyltransferase [Bacteroidaceae bacterium]|jgi:2-C-methyl-D-erythritol 4-phosphate cytidylyltransferase|nr:2-C-methyl-D-erythritol 4-phosphate cytidylyltransferase [Bacteroidaceae bacterium]